MLRSFLLSAAVFRLKILISRSGIFVGGGKGVGNHRHLPWIGMFDHCSVGRHRGHRETGLQESTLMTKMKPS